MSVVTDLGNAIAYEIGTSGRITFGTSFPVAFSYPDFDLKLESDGALRVDVVPVSNGYSVEQLDGQKFGHMVAYDFSIRKKFDSTDRDPTTNRILTASVETLVSLWQQLFLMFQPQNPEQIGPPLSQQPEALWMETITTAPYVKPHLREWGQYTGLFRTKFLLPTKSL